MGNVAATSSIEKKSTKSRRSAFAANSAKTMPIHVGEYSKKDSVDRHELLDQQKQYGDSVIKAVHALKQARLKEQDSSAKNQQTAAKVNSSNKDLQGFVQDVERFRNVIGSMDKLKKFIQKFSEEGGSGQIYEKQRKMAF